MDLTKKTQHFGLTIPAKRYDQINLKNVKICPLKLHALLAKHCEIFVFQKERGLTGYEHYQVYCKFVKDLCVLDVKNILKYKEIHIEPLLETPDFMKYYCMKQESRIGRVYKYSTNDLI